MQKDNVTLTVATQSVPDIAITCAIEPAITTAVTTELETYIFNITNLVIRNPPT